MSDSVGGGIQDAIVGAADRVQRVACGAACGVGELRAAIRAQPIAAALVVLAFGYLLGRLGSHIPSTNAHTHRR